MPLLATCSAQPVAARAPLPKYQAASAPSSRNTVVAPQPIAPTAPRVTAGASTSAATEYLPRRFSVVAHQQPLAALLFTLARDARINLDLHPGLSGVVTLNALDQTLSQLLDRIARQAPIRWQMQGDTLRVEPDTPYLATYPVDYPNLARKVRATVTLANSVTTGDPGSARPINTSTTLLDSNADHAFWAGLESNLRRLLGMPATAPAATVAVPIAAPIAAAASFAQAIAPPAAVAAEPEAQRQLIVNAETGLIAVMGHRADHRKVETWLAALQASAQRQVLIEATLVEVLLNDRYQAGVDWRWLSGGAGGWQLAQSLTGAALLDAPVALVSGGAAAGSNFALRWLEQFGQIRVLSSPKIMALNNQTAVMKVVDEQVYFTLELAEDRNKDGEISRRQYTSKLHTVPIGLVLQVLPQIAADGVIALNVRPTITNIRSWVDDPAVSLLAREGSKPVSSQVPVLQVREMDATLRVQSGQLAVLGGLIQETRHLQRHGVPGLSRLPGIGDLFSYRDDQVRRVELVVFLRPLTLTPDAAFAHAAHVSAPDDAFFAAVPADHHPAYQAGRLPPPRVQP
ncbi:Type II secretion system protein D precursor [Amantichitinum ursilacus]|uniref:Type II secretion system protein D n=1 Tax=Amantichitinum ursilacus TaxID=857265 RepID=A0A0N0GPT5_9NEIS|nr:Type II secretion system protein D precursor [Amantichitinum ursilacus]